MEPRGLESDLIDLHRDTVLKEKFISLKLGESYASLSAAKIPNIQKMEERMLRQAVSVSVPGCNLIQCRLQIISSDVPSYSFSDNRHTTTLFAIKKEKPRVELLEHALLSHFAALKNIG